MSQPITPVPILYDTIETALLAAGPSYGLQVEDRVTCIDMKTMAMGDEAVGAPAAESPGERLGQVMGGKISQEQAHIPDHTLPLFSRYATITYQGERYRFEFSVQEGDGSENRNTLEDINAVIFNGAYGINLEIFEWDATSDDGRGNSLFWINLRTECYSGEAYAPVEQAPEVGEIPEGISVSTRTFVGDDCVFNEEAPSHTGLIPKLREFAEQYPIRTEIDPILFITHFLETLRE